MLAWTWVRRIGLVGASAALVLGCVVESEPSAGYSGGGSAGTGGDDGGTCNQTPSSQPMLVDVDPNVTMTAQPGQGVGVFVQYKTGGHWNVWWTCDTDKSGLDCAYDNVVTVSTGTIANLQGQLTSPGSTATQEGTQKVEAVTNTSNNVDGMTFDTPFSTGQVPQITVNSLLGGCEFGQYFFFVQDGEIDGNYSGMLTDPLIFEPKSP